MKATAELTRTAETKVSVSVVQAHLDLLDHPGLLQKGDHFVVEEQNRAVTLVVANRRFAFRQGTAALAITFDWPGR